MDTRPDDADSPWKEALERYFPEFLELLFPRVHREVDWRRGVRFLDKEFQKVVRDSATGRRTVDKLAELWRRLRSSKGDADGERVRVHVEVQGAQEAGFGRRVNEYHARLEVHSDTRVVTLVVLTDGSRSWRPRRYRAQLWGFRKSLRFPTVKLLDWESRWEELDRSSNPFAAVVMAQLAALWSRRKPDERLDWKVALIRRIVAGYDPRGQEAAELTRLTDWFLPLPEEYEDELDRRLEDLRQEGKMPFVTNWERRAEKRGEERGEESASRTAVLEVLRARFGELPERLVSGVGGVEDVEVLVHLTRCAASAQSLEEFEAELPTPGAEGAGSEP